MEIGEELNRLFLAGVGAVAMTAEKSKELVDTLVKKGELTVSQGKELNEELKHNVKEKIREAVGCEKEASSGSSSILEKMEKMSPEELEAIRAKLMEMEHKKSE